MLKKQFVGILCVLGLVVSTVSYAGTHTWSITVQSKDVPTETYLDADVVCGESHNHTFQALDSAPPVFNVTGDDACVLMIGIRHPYSAEKPQICSPYGKATNLTSAINSFTYLGVPSSENAEGVACYIYNIN